MNPAISSVNDSSTISLNNKVIDREFIIMMPDNNNTSTRGLSRRSFTAGLGASIALASLSAGGVTTAAHTSATQRTFTLSPGSLAMSAQTALTKPPFAAVALNRLGFGPRPGDIAAFEALGTSDEQRLAAYVDRQLNPGDDPLVSARLADPAYTTLHKSHAQLWQDHKIDANHNGRYRPIDEVARAVFVRATYSEWQLIEVLADFWHNHFNIYGRDLYAAPTWVSYDRDVIRAHMLGNFRLFLEATAQSAAMLYYLDNHISSSEGPNEHYARELFELHTLGIENYYGLIPQSEVPCDRNGKPRGYVDNDVYEAARCFTGWKVSDHPTREDCNGDTGLFFYYDFWHDRFAKKVLGQYFPPDQGALQDGMQVLDLLAAHPGTARHIATKLCRRLISDDPPESVIDAAARVFHAKWREPDQLRQVVRTIILHPDFRNTPWGGKVKRPFETMVGAMRACDADFNMVLSDAGNSDDDSNHLWNFIGLAGHRPYHWVPPNGYPDERETWQSNTSLIQSWRALDWMLNRRAEGPDPLLPILRTTLDGLGRAENGKHTPDNLAHFWIERILGYVPIDLFDHMANFMAQPSNNTLLPWPRSQPIGRGSDSDGIDTDIPPHLWFSRLRAMIGLILSSPYAMQR
jgi:uncharacterized protein (DUF1800 family)